MTAMKEKAAGKWGPVVALMALVAVILVGFVAYEQLSHAVEPAAAEPAANPDDDAVLLAEHNPTVYTEGGVPMRLTEIADGRPLVVNFWATWCPYCIQEIPDYQEIYNDYGDRVAFAFIDCADGQRETVEMGASWLADGGYTLPAYYDTSGEAQISYGASSLPTTVVANAEGEILAISPGAIDPDLMRNALDSLL